VEYERTLPSEYPESATLQTAPPDVENHSEPGGAVNGTCG